DELSDDGTPLVDSQKIGVSGVSYGGGQSTMLATLRNRVVDPDGIVHEWKSPAGKPMQMAAAAPIWPRTDLAYSLLPNGRALDYPVNNAYRGPLGGAVRGFEAELRRGPLRTRSRALRVRPARRRCQNQPLERADRRGRAV